MNPRDLHQRVVAPFYLSLLHGNFLSDADPADFARRLHDAAHAITDPELHALLDERNWRPRLTAAWLIGLTDRRHFIDPLGTLLVASELCFAGQGYCAALGLLGGPRSVHHLETYLAAYLPFAGRDFDQHWAIGALAHIAPEPPHALLGDQRWPNPSGVERALERFRAIVAHLREHGLVAPI